MRSEDTPITGTEGTSRGGARLRSRRTGFLSVGAAGALLLALTPVQAPV